MGNPVVVFTTYGDSRFVMKLRMFLDMALQILRYSPFVELKSDTVPQSAQFSNGDFSVTDFDTIRIRTTERYYKCNGRR